MKISMLKLLEIYRPYKKAFIVIVILLLASTIANLLTPIINKIIVDKGFVEKNINQIMFWVSAIFVLRLIDLAFTFGIEKMRVKLCKKVKTQLEKKAFDKVMNMNLFEYQKENATSIISRLDIDINAIGMIVESNFFGILTQLMCIIGGVIGLIYIEWRLIFLVLISIIMKYLVIQIISRKNTILMQKYIQEMNGFAHWYSGTLNGIREIKIYDLKNNFQKQFEEKVLKKNETKRKTDLNESYKTIFDSFFTYLLDFLLYISGGYLIYKNSLSMGSVFAFLTYSTYIANPISTILNFRYLLSQIQPSVERYCAFMEKEGERKGGEKVDGKIEKIEIKNMMFRYTKDMELLENINIDWKIGKRNGLIGVNGSGKSTVIDLMLEFYEPLEGEIKLNNRDIKEYNLQEYRNLFSVVSQQIYLFNDSIRNNLCLEKEIPDSKIIAYMRVCGLAELLEEKGLDYHVGENGGNLSGGERQKLGLVRAMIQERPIVLLDEATSNADVFLERNIDRILKEEFAGKTIIMITHKMEKYRTCKPIFFINNTGVIYYENYNVFLENNPNYN